MKHVIRTIRTAPVWLALALCAILWPGCRQDPEDATMPPSDAVGDVDVAEEPVADGSFRHADWHPSPDPTRATFHGLEFDKPALWIETPPVTSLREANYTVPGRQGAQAAELAVLWFDIEFALPMTVHIKRLQSQFEPNESGDRPEASVETLDAGGLPVTLIDLRGAYVKPGSAWYTPDQRVTTAILETDRGQLLLRLAGPAATVQANLDAFRSMVESVRKIDADGSADRPDQPDSAENRRNHQQ